VLQRQGVVLSAPARKAARNWPYVFVLGAGWARGRVDHAKALDARRWTEVVQAVLKRQAGVGSEFRVYSSLRMMTSPTFTTEPRVGKGDMKQGGLGVVFQ